MLPAQEIATSFVFHADFIKTLPEELTTEWTAYCINYGLCAVEPTFKDPLHAELWRKIKDRIDNDKAIYEDKLQNQKLWKAKNHFKDGRATKKEIEMLKDLGLIKENNDGVKNWEVPKTPPIYEYEFKSDSEFKYDSEYEFKSEFKHTYESESDVGVCALTPQDFTQMWNKHTDVLGIPSTIEKPVAFAKYFQNPKVTKEYVERGLDNFCNAVKSGALDRRYIPATIDRFVLNNTLERFQKPYKNDKAKGSTIYDADHRGEFAEAERV